MAKRKIKTSGKKLTDEIKADLTYKEDLSVAVMNLIAIEEHLAFTAMKTGNDIYLDVLKEIRKLRVTLLKKLIGSPEGELWCISKHLLSATMRLMESSTKHLGEDNEEAMKLEKSAFDLYSLFWFLNKGAEKK
ncbi:MAG TPA: hypothetical protein VJJ76_03790 [archaeon]|nr:hypothetical protein [archaeon]